MVHNPHTPNRPHGDVEQLTPEMILQSEDEKGRTIVTLPAGAYESAEPLGNYIEIVTGEPLTGGPLYIVGGEE